jgi:hypothetical protein
VQKNRLPPSADRMVERSMATVSLRLPSSLAADKSAAAPRASIWRRMFDAMVDAQMRKAAMEIRRYQHLIPTDEVMRARYHVGQDEAGKLPFVR